MAMPVRSRGAAARKSRLARILATFTRTPAMLHAHSRKLRPSSITARPQARGDAVCTLEAHSATRPFATARTLEALKTPLRAEFLRHG
jgi:hypothetical protein